MGALAGIRVVETGSMVAAPYCAKLLGDLGAEVIKVEPPEGDPARRYGPFPAQPCGDGSAAAAGALFLYNNTSKRGMRCDFADPEQVELLRRLVDGADALIDDHAPAALEPLGLGLEATRRRNPGLVYTSVTPYGRTGPCAGDKGDELTLTHAGGLGNLLPSRSEDVDRAPVKLGGWQIGHIGGIVAALATVAALWGRRSDGRGRLVDVSLQEVVLALVSPLVAGNRYQHTTWSRVPDRPPAMGRLQTRDGYVILNAFDDHHFDALRELMGNPDWCAGEEWSSMAYRIHHLMEIAERIEDWMLTQDKEDVHHRAARRGIPIGPINSAADVLANPQYEARDFFVEVEHPQAGALPYAGVPYRLSASPARVSRPAPLLGEHGEEIRRELGARVTGGAPETGDAPSSGESSRAPLAGVRVAELCWVWAGPYAGMLLASLGAEVIKVEGHRRTDLTRRSVVWPLPEPSPQRLPPSQGMAFNAVNLGKKSLALDLTKPEGVDLARRLAGVSDVVVDNMRPGALARRGLGYEDLRRLREDLIVASSSGRGHVGPERDYLGFASVHQGIGGGAYITGYADDHPCHSGGDVDLMNAMTLAMAIVAALHHRSATGEGQFIDYSQCEGVSALVGDLLLGYAMSGDVPERMGNRHPVFAPHGVYRAWGVDRWVALEVHDDEEFARLAALLGRPQLAADPRFATARARQAHAGELDALLAEWMRPRDRDWVVAHLREAGLAAAPSREARDLYADRHLRAREAFVTVEHPELGPLELARAPWRLEGVAPLSRPAPLLGADNDEILRDLLGLGAEEVTGLRERDVVL